MTLPIDDKQALSAKAFHKQARLLFCIFPKNEVRRTVKLKIIHKHLFKR